MYQTLTKLEIAELQLNQSIAFYLEGKDLISAVTLAGAAEEILGKMNRAAERTDALNDQVKLCCKTYETVFKKKAKPKDFVEIRNRARNELKHLGSEDLIKIDLDYEAYSLISRAIENYKKIKSGFSKQFRDVEREMLRRHTAEQAEMVKK